MSWVANGFSCFVAIDCRLCGGEWNDRVGELEKVFQLFDTERASLSVRWTMSRATVPPSMMGNGGTLQTLQVLNGRTAAEQCKIRACESTV